MKKITLILFLVATFNLFSQSTTTGEITLTPGFTIQFDYDATNAEVTLTMVGPADVWLGVGINAQSMAYPNRDVVIYSSSGLRDYYLTGSYSTPSIDNNDWTTLSNTTSGNVRTIVAKRPSNTGQSTDYVFTSSTESVPFIWAKGNGLSLSYHGSRGTAIVPFVLGTPEPTPQFFEIYPNPITDVLNLKFPADIQEVNVRIYDVLGKMVQDFNMSPAQPTLNTSSWRPGMYIIQMVTGDNVQTKRVIKQ